MKRRVCGCGGAWPRVNEKAAGGDGNKGTVQNEVPYRIWQLRRISGSTGRDGRMGDGSYDNGRPGSGKDHEKNILRIVTVMTVMLGTAYRNAWR